MPSAFVDEILRPFWGLWLMAVFIAIIAAVYWPGNRKRLEEHGSIPLRDDEEQESAPWHR
ncbi:cbb3-type cytochrome oxidase subunit 3 [Magnetospirillum molischianum]|uniref:Cbb3-type cytochrome oxidase, subunit 3 n=1 Tax=Magnetospirillum molischianum DSM 120 TaxID=1150626 RepID=H8FX20_MAGML|nr:cbb3-type cytochrome c oxidase subunit 3 [Magnetospirillum molischianum]CCG42908.1 hypothetical protein PHAMO_510022 [Magnetospirillum molischianum DSM 120]